MIEIAHITPAATYKKGEVVYMVGIRAAGSTSFMKVGEDLQISALVRTGNKGRGPGNL